MYSIGVFSTIVYISVQTNDAHNGFRTSTITAQYVTTLAMSRVSDQPVLNVSITVWDLRCDMFVVFSAR